MVNNEIEKKEEYLIIPNPIYDVVFKYLMEDNESAIIILSTLINEKIIKLTFEPLSYSQKIKDPTTEKEIRLFHLDFTATIELDNGTEELIMIELQKAQRASDIFRFKRYISANFQKKKEVEIIDPETKAIKKINKPIRLIPIFILNFRIENEINDLIIKTNRIKTGIFKEETLKSQNEFINNLSYDIWVVQLPNLHNIKKMDYEKSKYKTKLYYLLKLFDQEARKKDNRHRLLLIRKIFPGFLERVIRRLKSADADNQDLEEQMNTEDEYLSELEEQSNKTIFFKEKLNITEKKLDNTEKKLEVEKSENLQNKQIIVEFAKILKESGASMEKIQEKTKLSKEEIEELSR